MACAACQKGREAVSASSRALAAGNLTKAAVEAGNAMQAVGEKVAETLRVRALTRRP